MEKKSISAWLFIAVFVLLSIGCFACCMWNKVLVPYGFGFACLAWMLYRSDE